MTFPSALRWCLVCSLALPALPAQRVLARTTSADAVIVSGINPGGQLPVGALGLGDGGIAEAAAPVATQRGQVTTAGGVLVRAQAEGVKFDFPSGAELLLAPTGRVHLRSGEHTEDSDLITELLLGDGTRVRCLRAGGGRPFADVQVVHGDRCTTIWRNGVPLSMAARVPFVHGKCYAVVDDGDVVYAIDRLGPVITMRRAVCGRAELAQFPATWVVVVGDLLAESLRMLPRHVPLQAVQIEIAANAQQMAALSSVLFPSGLIHRPPAAIGELWFQLPRGFRLVVEERGRDEIWIGLHQGSAPVPVVEWRAGMRTSLHLVRPHGGEGGRPRHYLTGIDLSDRARAVLPLPLGAAPAARSLEILRDFGIDGSGALALPASTRR